MVEINEVFENISDDIQSTSSDINDLHSKFIGPIDRIRSISTPAPINAFTISVPKADEPQIDTVTRNNFTNIDINANRPLESRAHAFYRSLGLPVVAPDGSFYNSGFLTVNSEDLLKKREAVNNKLLSDDSLQTLMRLREIQVNERLGEFVFQDASSSAYTLALRHIKNFMVADDKL